jgi:hypothetical protein
MRVIFISDSRLCGVERMKFLSVGVNDISENIYDRTERELTKVYERVIRKYQQVDQGIYYNK